MGKVTVHAGDWHKGDGRYSLGLLTLPKGNAWTFESINLHSAESIQLATEENVKRIGGTVGWGVAGAALLGPVGLLAGLLLGGRGKDVTFIVRFKDGRKLLATTDAKTYTAIQAASF